MEEELCLLPLVGMEWKGRSIRFGDSREAVVGTINLDYRSLYHHFECAAWMYRTECIGEIEADFLATREKCRRVTPQTIWQGSRGLKILSWLMKAVAPLM